MAFVRKHIAFRFLWLLMALHILNCSVDAPDARPEYIPEDLSYNEMESIVEIVLEQVLDIDNAIPEHDDNDNELPGFLAKKGVDYSYCQSCSKMQWAKYLIIELPANLYQYKDNYAFLFHPEIIPPPPKA